MIFLINKDEFDEMYKIMEESFPTDEYRPYAEQKELLENNLYKLYVNKNNHGQVDAFIALWNFNDFVFIEHFAVSKNVRNCGIGSNILASVKAMTDKIHCLEVEIPDNDLSARRVAFYERNGFHLNTYSYMQPPISKGKNPVPLMIMTSGRKINEKEFQDVKRELYKKVYKVDDSEL